MLAKHPTVQLSDAEYLANIGDLWGRGWSIIPLRWGTKLPAIRSWTEYQQRPATFEQLEQWFDRPELFNVGIVTGRVSGIFVLDCDSPEAIGWATEYMPISDLRVRTAKGLHLYYTYTAERPIRNKVRTRFDGRQLELDIRCDGGYVVGPASLHESGFVYTREGAGWGRL